VHNKSRSRLAPIDDGMDDELDVEPTQQPPPYVAPSSLVATKKKMVRAARHSGFGLTGHGDCC
jgi:hypothetical protein